MGISLHYLMKEVTDEVVFLHADKHERLLQTVTMILMGMVRYSQSSQNSKFVISLQYLKKKLEMKLIFCLWISIKISYKLISTLWASKFPTGSYYYYWWAWLSIFKVLKVISLRYCYNTSKKLGMEFIFCMQINIKVSTSWHYLFWWKWPDMSTVPKIESW